jgi:hypothetical protein
MVEELQKELGVDEDRRAASCIPLRVYEMDAEIALDDLGSAAERVGVAREGDEAPFGPSKRQPSAT